MVVTPPADNVDSSPRPRRHEEEEAMNVSARVKGSVAAAALVLGGFGVGTAVAITGSASAATDAVSNTVNQVAQTTDPSQPMRSDEQLLTGSTAQKVTTVVEARYPRATIQRVETDSDGVYEAHIVTSGGRQLIVQVGKDFAVTGTQDFGGFGRGGVPDPKDNDGPDA
jgi:hypothetical protein